jgi:hypothetical protein
MVGLEESGTVGGVRWASMGGGIHRLFMATPRRSKRNQGNLKWPWLRKGSALFLFPVLLFLLCLVFCPQLPGLGLVLPVLGYCGAQRMCVCVWMLHVIFIPVNYLPNHFYIFVVTSIISVYFFKAPRETESQASLSRQDWWILCTPVEHANTVLKLGFQLQTTLA